MSMIHAAGVAKRFGRRWPFARASEARDPRRAASHGDGTVHALRGVDLDVRAGEAVAIVGPNGAGKTTLLEILATLVRPDAGRAAVGGCDVVGEARAVRRLVAYCPASPAFDPALSGLENLRFFAALHGASGEAARRRIEAALELVDLVEAAGAPVGRYSDGMRQRLALARTFITRAPVLLLDEPTRSLDSSARLVVQAHLRRLVEREGCTVLLVTHSEDEARAVCDRVVRLERGVVTGAGARDVTVA
jgi:heme ABC exporter ATP-binding subunit CcmA